MCTATWIHGAEELELFFNRDESKTRGPETAPITRERAGLRYLAPGDSEGGGTWIAAAESGLCLALLNAYGPGRGSPPERPTSRGLLIPALIDQERPDRVAQALLGQELESYRPFVLLALAPGPQAQNLRRLHWDGLELSIDPEPPMPLSSSGVEQQQASEYRRDLLRRMQDESGALTPALLDSFHKSHEGGPNALTPCMHRVEAETRSRCRVHVEPERVSMHYVPGAPCRAVEASASTLERSGSTPHAREALGRTLGETSRGE